MPISNKFRAFCFDCRRDVLQGEGLSEMRRTLNLPGDGWVTKHQQCSFTPVRRVPYKRYEPELIQIYDDWDEFNITGGLTESEFFGGDVGDKG